MISARVATRGNWDLFKVRSQRSFLGVLSLGSEALNSSGDVSAFKKGIVEDAVSIQVMVERRVARVEFF
jgi:hypothetical protein